MNILLARRNSARCANADDGRKELCTSTVTPSKIQSRRNDAYCE